MKKLFLFLIIALLTSLAYAQIKSNDTPFNVNKLNVQSNDVTYQLYPTLNMWTFIKLNTRNGQMWQVQYDTKEKNRMQVLLNAVPLNGNDAEKDGRFKLYPTQNIYTFILLDQVDGRAWQAQWSTEMNECFVIPIDYAFK